ncbi:MAG TPA: c-type cytochrome [Leptospiraceae bacterium]|nr:c-type cytochrome [Leptospiraceae bacterium]HMW05998.1 c-type cytochrome [Leptospiraceae bacterium]HMY32358.1 c-type cytochrome [Leptospiraceae bacterium]HMZ62440.1 c-type cytochrome [Leptospiraceae bacterium]HNC00507.1 c-type cytochrome [Leptospiraceae bacterium]
MKFSILKKVLIGFLVVIGCFCAFVMIRFEMEKSKTYSSLDFEITTEVEKADLELGKRIYHVRAGCVDCHGKDLSGAKIMENGAMGVIYGANISPFNLKNWSDKEIARAIRYGVHKTGRSLRFMPSFDYQSLSKGDIAAVVKYIRSQPEVTKPSHENTFGPVAKILSALNKIPVLFPAKMIDQQKGFADKPAEEVGIQFGEYLANSCVGCHGMDYKGGPIPGADPSWPPASNIRLGANSSYSLDSFREMIKTGVSPSSKQELKFPMPIWLLKEFNDKEIESLWIYLSSLK